MHKSLSLLILLILTIGTRAQTMPEYRMELGGGIGAIAYLGDFNTSVLKNLQPMATLLAKYKFDPRRAISLNVSYGQLKGSSKDANTYYPDITDYSFKTGVVDAGVRFEDNFWPYGTGFEYRGAKRLTPYIYIGVGMTVAKPDKTEVSVNLPFGAGVKYKVADRVNISADWTMVFTHNDRLDGVSDPYGIISSGLFKNQDGYSQLRVAVTYDLWTKCRTCHNDRD